MSIFAQAALDAADDGYCGVDATIYPAAGGSPVAVRVIPSRPTEAFGGFDRPRMTAPAAVVMIPAASVTVPPVRKDRLTWTGAPTYEVAEVAIDTRGASYTLTLTRA